MSPTRSRSAAGAVQPTAAGGEQQAPVGWQELADKLVDEGAARRNELTAAARRVG